MRSRRTSEACTSNVILSGASRSDAQSKDERSVHLNVILSGASRSDAQSKNERSVHL